MSQHIYRLIDDQERGFQVQLYRPEIRINRNTVFFGLNTALRIGNDGFVPKGYKSVALVILGFGFGVAWWPPRKEVEVIPTHRVVTVYVTCHSCEHEEYQSEQGEEQHCSVCGSYDVTVEAA